MKDRFDFKEAEPRLSARWEERKVYKFDEKSKKKIYAIDTPPPTISGLISVGHAFSYSQADFIARYKRMKGFNVFYPFGFDNNGLATEILVEKTHNITAEKVGREKFIELVEAETKKYEEMYRTVWKAIGLSVDWSLLYTTIGNDARKISQLSFLELTKAGRTYRKETPTIWCPKDKTALSQMELKDKVLKSQFVKVRFSDDVVIATTRPEMLPACVAIFVNPEDKKNAHFIGKKVKVPIFGNEVMVMTDRRVDPEKGTGLVMCCTFGDQTDIEWYKAYNLDLKIVINEKGRMIPEYFQGKGIREAREMIIKDLEGKGLVLEKREIEHTVNVHERCNTEIEFLVKQQWYIRYLDMKEKLVELGRSLEWHPEHMVTRYENWVNGLQWDWSIARQRYYGIPFPVWYCKKCNEPIFADEKDLPVNPLKDKPKGKCQRCGSEEFVPEEDVFDTWATSSLTPLLNARWGLDKRYMQVFPMDLRPQAHDIISFWLFTTIVKSYLHTGKLPWKTALISGHGLDPKGMPMHKSAGNVIEPKVAIEKYGADPLRYWASIPKIGDDASYQEKDLMTGAKFVNKLWNVAKFVDMNKDIGESEGSKNVIDRWMMSRLVMTIKDVGEMFESYNSAGAKRITDEFFWFFADNYLEFIKYRTYAQDKEANYALNYIFRNMIKLFAPFLPYITDEIYLSMYAEIEKRESVHVSDWPEADERLFDKDAFEKGEELYRIIAFIRQWKHDNKMALNAPLERITLSKKLDDGIEDIKGAMNVREIAFGKGTMDVPETGVKIGFG
ncbi:MAG: valine--tRNA ligase [Candidatus Micrarchaeota archaeon]|nr:valine--tRNA ligase [Candidatus Micrarchaeota archaeon]